MMPAIGGNTTAELQIKSTTLNEIGERIPSWETVNTLRGFLDLQSGDSRYTNHYAKIEESTHVFVCDYVELNSRVVTENSRLLINGKTYDVTLIDDPMGLHYQLEIFLRLTGGQNG